MSASFKLVAHLGSSSLKLPPLPPIAPASGDDNSTPLLSARLIRYRPGASLFHHPCSNTSHAPQKESEQKIHCSSYTARVQKQTHNRSFFRPAPNGQMYANLTRFSLNLFRHTQTGIYIQVYNGRPPKHTHSAYDGSLRREYRSQALKSAMPTQFLTPVHQSLCPVGRAPPLESSPAEVST